MARAPVSIRLLLGAAVVAVAFALIGAVAGLDGRATSAIVLLIVSVGAIASGTVLVADLGDVQRHHERWMRERNAPFQMTGRAAGAYVLVAGALLAAYVVAMLTALR